VVENVPYALAFLATAVRKAGLEVETATTGSEAVEKFRLRPADLLVIDHRLDGTTGEIVYAAIRGIRASTPAILVTGFAGEVKRPEQFLQVISKPFRVNVLLDAVRAALSLE